MDSEDISSDDSYDSRFTDDSCDSSFLDDSELDDAFYYDDQGNIALFTDDNTLEAEEELHISEN